MGHQAGDILLYEIVKLRRQLHPSGPPAHHHKVEVAAALLLGQVWQPRVLDHLAALKEKERLGQAKAGQGRGQGGAAGRFDTVCLVSDAR